MKKFPDWWRHNAKVRVKSGSKTIIVTLNISEDWEYWFTDENGKEVAVFSLDILGPAVEGG